MPASPSAIGPLLSEQQGWAIATADHNDKEANLLIHTLCGMAFPNWWLSPHVLKIPEGQSGIVCKTCNAVLPYDVFKVFYGAYRLLNMTRKSAL